jgi:hypothetical protein
VRVHTQISPKPKIPSRRRSRSPTRAAPSKPGRGTCMA